MQKLADRNDETDPQSALIPRERFGLQQFYQTAYLLERKLRRKCLTYLHVREYLHNLAYLYDQFIERFGLDYSNVCAEWTLLLQFCRICHNGIFTVASGIAVHCVPLEYIEMRR